MNIPTISITKQCDINEIFDTGNNYNYNINESHTDIEDFDSNDEETNSKSLIMKTLKTELVNNRSPSATDIEDYCDSDMEEEKTSLSIPTVHQLPFEELLDIGSIEEKVQLSNKITIKRESKIIKGNFSKNLSVELDDPECLTDYENIDTSDDESGIYAEITTCINENQKETIEIYDHISNEIIKEITSDINDMEGKK